MTDDDDDDKLQYVWREQINKSPISSQNVLNVAVIYTYLSIIIIIT